jgi:predicted RNase H-like HicB family nuclease
LETIELAQAVDKALNAAQEQESVPAFTAVFRRDPVSTSYWLVELADEPRVHSFGRTIAEAEQRIEDATRVWHEIPLGVEINLHARFDDPDVDDALQRAEQLRFLQEVASQALQAAIRASIELLKHRVKLSTRDTGAVLGVSHQRVHQLLTEERSSEAQAPVEQHERAIS